MISTICGVYERFGFAQLETSAIEYLDVLGKFLPENDQPDAGVFAFRDDNAQWLSLRYDLTAPLSRVVAQYKDDLPSPYRRYQVGPVWRREKPGPGRFRQFYQCDFDTVGANSPAADAEVCAVVCAALNALGISNDNFVVRVNNRKILTGVLEKAGIGAAETQLAVLRAIDKLDRLGIDGVCALLGQGRKDASGDVTKGAGLQVKQIDAIQAFIGAGGRSRADVVKSLGGLVAGSKAGEDGVGELEQIDALLDAMGFSSSLVTFDPTVVRGLAYYTGPVFEAELKYQVADEKGQKRAFGSIAGGGRYDDLVKRFTGTDVPATGLSIGVDRLLAALRAMALIETSECSGPVVVTVLDRGRLPEYQAMVAELRAAGVASELYLGDKGFRAQLKYADKRKAPAAVICGEDEFKAGRVAVKDMRLGAALAATVVDRDEWRSGKPAQQAVARSALVETVKSIVAGKTS